MCFNKDGDGGDSVIRISPKLILQGAEQKYCPTFL